MKARWIGGLNPVATAVSLGAGHVRLVQAERRRNDARLENLLSRAEQAGIAVERVQANALEQRVPGIRHQGVIAEIVGAGMLEQEALEAHLDGLDHAPLLVLLDGVQDPHNLGACLRSAEAAGADAVIIPRDRAARLTPTVERAAAGAAQCLPLAGVTNLGRTLDALRRRGCWAVGMAGDAGRGLYQADLQGSLALVLGGEDRGVRPATRKRCDDVVRLPLQGRTESLNVSVAAGVCLFEAVRQRGPQ
jgi:23S rRNA (guanosine2251-2'-O)-methyltransferase